MPTPQALAPMAPTMPQNYYPYPTPYGQRHMAENPVQSPAAPSGMVPLQKRQFPQYPNMTPITPYGNLQVANPVQSPPAPGGGAQMTPTAPSQALPAVKSPAVPGANRSATPPQPAAQVPGYTPVYPDGPNSSPIYIPDYTQALAPTAPANFVPPPIRNPEVVGGSPIGQPPGFRIPGFLPEQKSPPVPGANRSATPNVPQAMAAYNQLQAGRQRPPTVQQPTPVTMARQSQGR